MTIINNRTETQYSTKIFPTPKSPITFPEKTEREDSIEIRVRDRDTQNNETRWNMM